MHHKLLEKIALGEDSTLELKQVTFSGARLTAPRRDALADELAALANAGGGTCVLGVEDSSRRIIGIAMEHLDATERFALEICNDSIDPPLFAHIEKCRISLATGATPVVVVIDVPRSLFVHKSPGGYFHRVGSSKRDMPPDYLARLFQQRSQARLIRFDEHVVPRATLAEMDERLWRRFQTPRSRTEAPEVFLQKLGLARADEQGIVRPTVAGVLLATADPRAFLPNAYIQAVAYAGDRASPEVPSRAYQLDATDVCGPIDQQVTDAMRFVARNMRTAATKHIGRRDIPQYDQTAIFEALVNAVAHRDYAVHGAKIRLRMFTDRLELASPGALSNTMTVDSLPLRQSARNEVLTSLLARVDVPPHLADGGIVRAGMMDRRGEGVGIILDRSEALSGRRPEYRLVDEAELVLTIWAAQPPM